MKSMQTELRHLFWGEVFILNQISQFRFAHLKSVSRPRLAPVLADKSSEADSLWSLISIRKKQRCFRRMGLWRELVELTSCCHQHTACNITYDDTAQTAQLKQTDTSQTFPGISLKVQFFYQHSSHSGAFEWGLLKAVVWNNWSASSVFQQDIFLLLFISPMGGWGLAMWSALSRSLSVSFFNEARAWDEVWSLGRVRCSGGL